MKQDEPLDGGVNVSPARIPGHPTGRGFARVGWKRRRSSRKRTRAVERQDRRDPVSVALDNQFEGRESGRNELSTGVPGKAPGNSRRVPQGRHPGYFWPMNYRLSSILCVPAGLALPYLDNPAAPCWATFVPQGAGLLRFGPP